MRLTMRDRVWWLHVGGQGTDAAYLCSRNEAQHLCSWGLPGASKGGKNICRPGGAGRSRGLKSPAQTHRYLGVKQGKDAAF